MPDPVTFEFNVDGKGYKVDFSNLTGVEARQFRLAVGLPVLTALGGIQEGSIDPLEVVAGLKWIIDRRDDPSQEYEAILAGLTYESVSFDDVKEEEDEEEGPFVSASAPTSPPSPSSTDSDLGNSTNSPTASLTST